MSTKLDERDHIACFWFADDLDGNNFLMLLRRREDRWMVDYRFRVVIDEKVFDSTDRKRFFHADFVPGTSEADAFKTCQEMFQLTNKEFCINCICQRVDGGVEKFVEALKKYPCFHSKAISRGEYNERTG